MFNVAMRNAEWNSLIWKLLFSNSRSKNAEQIMDEMEKERYVCWVMKSDLQFFYGG